MKSKISFSIFTGSASSSLKRVGVASLMTMTVSLSLLNSCSEKNKGNEDLDSLKLVGYDGLDLVSLFKAIENDDLAALKIFNAQKFDLKQTDLKGHTGMHVAAENGSMAALNYLYKQGVGIDVVDSKGLTPLMVAARAGMSAGNDGNAEVIKYLLEKGANAQTKDLQKKFPLIHALDGNSPQAIELLAAQSRELLDTGLLYSADLNKYLSIPVLVRYGASVYARNSGKTGLMIAAERGHYEAVQALVDEGANLYAMSDDGMLAMDFAEGDEEVMAVLLGAENEVGAESLALEWSDEELEALVQQAMERSPVVGDVNAGSVITSKKIIISDEAKVLPLVAMNGGGGESSDSSTPSSSDPNGTLNNNSDDVSSPTGSADLSSQSKVVVERIRGKNLPLEFSDNKQVARQVTMTAYAEKSLPVRVQAVDEGRVEVYDLRITERAKEVNPTVSEGSEIGLTGLRVKQIRKKIVNNKLTGGQDKELVTLMVENTVDGTSRELYAGYESQAAESVAVLKMNETGEHLIVERNDEFYDLKGTSYKVIDVNDKEVIIENTGTGQLSLLPLMGVKR